jgi:hypothetical protein
LNISRSPRSLFGGDGAIRRRERLAVVAERSIDVAEQAVDSGKPDFDAGRRREAFPTIVRRTSTNPSTPGGWMIARSGLEVQQTWRSSAASTRVIRGDDPP